MAIHNTPMSAETALELYFMDNRARMLEIASFLDRIDRYDAEGKIKSDFRYRAFMDALKMIIQADKARTVKIQRLLSDQSADPIDRVADGKAYGAWKEYAK